MNRLCHLSIAAAIGAITAGVSGCSQSPPRVHVPPMDPEAAGESALADYDVDQDGAIAGAELDKCPGLKAGRAVIDTDKDGRVTAEEIAARIREYQRARVGLVQFYGSVSLDGNPLRDAVVTFVPETFMGTGLEPAVGETDPVGNFSPQVEGMDIPGAQCGLYRIKVSKKDPNGQETVPAKFNTETVLGVELSAHSPILMQGLALRLSSQ